MLTVDTREILKGSLEELQKVIEEDNIFRMESILRKKKRGRDTFLLVKWKGYPEIVELMRKTSRTYRGNVKIVTGHFLSNRNEPNTGILSDITKQQFYADIPYKYLEKFHYTASKFTLSQWRLGSRTCRHSISIDIEPGATINNSLITSPYLSLSTGNASSLYVYTNIIHSQYVVDIKVRYFELLM